MNPKPQPNHQRYLEVLRAMTPAQRLKKAFELTEQSLRQFRESLKVRFPNLSEAELHKVYVGQRLACKSQDDWERMLVEEDF